MDLRFSLNYFLPRRSRHSRFDCDWSSDVCSSDLGGKLIRSTLVETYSANTVAADIGYLAESLETKTSFGLTLANFGPGMSYSGQKDPLPAVLRCGVAYRDAFTAAQ